MNQIKRIKIENIKGKQLLEASFSDLIANQPNLVVAPNGYGKSTISIAFKSAMHGKIKLDPRDIYQQNVNNHPRLEIELLGENAGTYCATDAENNITSNISLWVINNPLYAKSTTRSFGQRTTSTADLRVEDIIIQKNIPQQKSIEYTYSFIKNSFGDKGKLFFNIGNMLSDVDNINRLYSIKDQLKKCIDQVRIQSSFDRFLENCSSTGTTSEIKCAIASTAISALRTNSNVAALFDCIIEMNNKPDNWQENDLVFTAIQICKTIGKHYANGESDILKNVSSYLEYKKLRELVDERLNDFNTTGRTVRTHEDHGKLIVRFERANSMSNGERDILSLVTNLTIFEYYFRKKVGILIIDEVFDYLDGSNMLAVQFYIHELIKKCKASEKVLYPIIFTHLDPEVFSNYYFNKRKVHYISFSSVININSPIIKMLRLRENNTISSDEKEEIEKYYIHFIDETYTMRTTLANRIAASFTDSNEQFRQKMYDEITQRYLHDQAYNSVMVIAGVRIRIEEIIYHQLDVNFRNGYIEEHKVINKLKYASSRGIEIPELFYLLQPLYNDGLHLGGSDESVRNKIKSSYLKTNNLHIKKMIEQLFD